MQKAKAFSEKDATIMAYHFYAPILVLLFLKVYILCFFGIAPAW
jgi:hypothetical protein